MVTRQLNFINFEFIAKNPLTRPCSESEILTSLGTAIFVWSIILNFRNSFQLEWKCFARMQGNHTSRMLKSTLCSSVGLQKLKWGSFHILITCYSIEAANFLVLLLLSISCIQTFFFQTLFLIPTMHILYVRRDSKFHTYIKL